MAERIDIAYDYNKEGDIRDEELAGVIPVDLTELLTKLEAKATNLPSTIRVEKEGDGYLVSVVVEEELLPVLLKISSNRNNFAESVRNWDPKKHGAAFSEFFGQINF